MDKDLKEMIARGMAVFSAQQFVTGVARAGIPITAKEGTVVAVARTFEKYIKEG